MSIPLAPDFAERKEIQLNYEERGFELYATTRGDYSTRIDLDIRGDIIPLGDDLGDLTGTEVFIAHQLEGLLNSPPSSNPILAVDVGGGLGTTTLRLGVYFKEPIAHGRLALAVTNLASSPDAYIKHNTPDLTPLREAAGDTVHFISTPFSRLAEQSITVNGKTLPIEGNVHLVHERLSLTSWSYIPELHIRQIGHLLSRVNGLYMVPHDDARYPRTMVGKPSYLESRRQGIRLGHAALREEFGLTRHDYLAPTDTKYIGFRSPATTK